MTNGVDEVDCDLPRDMPTQAEIDAKKARLLAGERVVTNDKELDMIEPDDRFRRLCSLPNPERVGLRDAYVAWLAPVKPCKVGNRP